MNHRSNESPMDFQWQSGFGPASFDSPFLKHTAQGNMSSQNSFAGQKRDFDHFDSPKKPLQSGSQGSFFPSTPSVKPLSQFRTPSFTTPHKSFDTDFSSGPENQSSPLADNEDTPDPPARDGSNTNSAMVQFQGFKTDKMAPSTGIFGKYATPGRGEIIRKPHTDLVARRVHKRRRREIDRDVRLALRRPSDESDYEKDTQTRSGSPARPAPTPQEVGFIPSILTFMEAHPNLPDVLSRYAQFILNLFFVSLLIVIMYCSWATIRSDVDEASREVAAETMAEMVMCTREFKANKCDSADRVPAMESMCNSWEKCMNRDPTMVGRARVSAQTFAEIITSFADRISYKTMLLSSILLLGFWGISNVTFSIFRHKHAAHPPAPHAGYYPPQGMGQENFYPYQHQQGQMGMGGGTGMMGQGSGGPGFASSPKKLEY
ncbi:MAG: hypothetical protein Q9191_006435 [Dirinaria sp. TL-2023a]